MSEAVGVWGRLAFDDRAAWLREMVQEDAWPDWAPPLDGAGPYATGTVKALLAAAKKHADGKAFFVDLDLGDKMATVRAVLSLDDHLDGCAALAAAWRAAANHAGEGELFVLPLEVGACARVAVGSGKSRCVKAPRPQAVLDALQEAIEDLNPFVATMRGEQRKRVALLSGDAAAQAWRTRVLDALGAQSPEAIALAARKGDAQVQLGKKWIHLRDVGDARAILDTLRAPAPPDTQVIASYFGAPLTLLAEIDGRAAESFALEMMELAIPSNNKTAALYVIRKSRRAEAVPAVLGLLAASKTEPSALGQVAATTLLSMTEVDIVTPVLALLTPELFKIKGRPMLLGRKPDDLKFRFICLLCTVLGSRPDRAAFDALARIYKEHPLESVRMMAGQCLLQGGKPTVGRTYFGPGRLPWPETKKKVAALLKQRGASTRVKRR